MVYLTFRALLQYLVSLGIIVVMEFSLGVTLMIVKKTVSLPYLLSSVFRRSYFSFVQKLSPHLALFVELQYFRNSY